MNIIDCVNGALELGVVGGGTMGLGIAQVAAQRSLGCAVLEVDPGARERARSQLTKALTKADERGKLAGTLDEALGCITWAESVKDLADCGVIIEAIPEIKEAKLGVFADLDEVCSPRTILASNTSSIPIATLAAATTRPGRVVGLHFFNPVPAMQLVEVVASLTTDDDVTHAAEAFVRDRLGKQTIRAKDQAGFVVNAIFVPYLLSAIRSFDNGVASAEDIDAGMVGGCGMPMVHSRCATSSASTRCFSSRTACTPSIKTPQPSHPHCCAAMSTQVGWARRQAVAFTTTPMDRRKADHGRFDCHRR